MEYNEGLGSIRTKKEPKKTGIGYKVFYQKDGKLYPPMVANPGGEDTPIGVWLDADAAPIVGTSKTGRPQVKNGGKGTQGGSGTLAYRPGWHLGLIPYAIQFNRKDENGEKTLFPKDFVWAEVEYAADKNYQNEAEAEGYTDNGKYRHSYAGLKHLPTDGYYIYRTNPNPDTDPWIITGAMKVNRILSNDEVDDLVRKAGREPQRREGEGLGELEDMSFEGLGSRLYGGVEQPSANTYRMLGRLKSDCDYYLGHGNRYAGHLYHHNEVLQIKDMIEIWDSLPDDKKPEWLTIDQLEKYSVELTGKTIEEFKNEYMSDDISEADDDYKASKYFGLKVAENKDELERGINEILSQYASREMASNQAINYMDESPEISKEWLRDNGLKSRDDFKKWAANRQSKVRKPILEKQEKELKEAKKTIADIRVANILKKAHEEAERWDREHNEDKKENDYFSLSEKLADLYKAGLKLDIQKSKAVAQSMGISITDSELMQACETAVVIEARRIADSEMSIKDKYFKLVDLYGRQVTVQPKDTYAMSLQQYSTPCPIAYLLGVYVNQGLKEGIDEVCYEPTAGNGLLTIALDPKKTVVNELDKVRYENLKRLGFAQVTNYDISKTELAKNSVAGIIMNPPFDSLDKKDFLVRKRMVMGREGVFTFERLDHKIAISVLEMMRDNGRAAIIIGGKMAVKFKDYKESYWKDGAIYGQYRTFINYLNRQYNVEDVIYLNGDLYRKQGTTFPIVVILINGRTPWNFSREHQWHTFDPVKDSQIDTFNEFFIRMEDHLSLNDKIKVSEDRKRALALLQLAKAKLALAKANEK